MIVCIAEKPSVARDIAEVLGAHTRKEGYIEGTIECKKKRKKIGRSSKDVPKGMQSTAKLQKNRS